jgi:hypothetical protein
LTKDYMRMYIVLNLFYCLINLIMCPCVLRQGREKGCSQPPAFILQYQGSRYLFPLFTIGKSGFEAWLVSEEKEVSGAFFGHYSVTTKKSNREESE